MFVAENQPFCSGLRLFIHLTVYQDCGEIATSILLVFRVWTMAGPQQGDRSLFLPFRTEFSIRLCKDAFASSNNSSTLNWCRWLEYFLVIWQGPASPMLKVPSYVCDGKSWSISSRWGRPCYRLILGLRPTNNERRRYKVTASLIGWAQAQNQPSC